MLYESFNGYLGFSLFILTTVGYNCMLFAMGDKRAFNTRYRRYRIHKHYDAVAMPYFSVCIRRCVRVGAKVDKNDGMVRNGDPRKWHV